MTKQCAKCNLSFECRMDDIKNCHCSTVVLESKTLDLLKDKYENCLCATCLKEFAEKEA